MRKVILDIRSKREYDAGHLPGAIHVETPLPPLKAQAVYSLAMKLQRILEQFGADAKYAVYCKKGTRSTLAASMLRAMGASRVTNLGGIESEPLANYVKEAN